MLGQVGQVGQQAGQMGQMAGAPAQAIGGQTGMFGSLMQQAMQAAQAGGAGGQAAGGQAGASGTAGVGHRVRVAHRNSRATKPSAPRSLNRTRLSPTNVNPYTALRQTTAP
jgi:hypothetical protein